MQKIAQHMPGNEIKGKEYHHRKLRDVDVLNTYFIKDHYQVSNIYLLEPKSSKRGKSPKA